MAVVLPYIVSDGGTFPWSTSYDTSTYYSTRISYSNFSTSIQVTINDWDRDTKTVNLTFNSTTTITRSGYNHGVWTFSAQPTFRIRTNSGTVTETLYNSSLNTTVASGGSSNIVHNSTFDYVFTSNDYLDYPWDIYNSMFYYEHNTGKTTTINGTPSASFELPSGDLANALFFGANF